MLSPSGVAKEARTAARAVRRWSLVWLLYLLIPFGALWVFQAPPWAFVGQLVAVAAFIPAFIGALWLPSGPARWACVAATIGIGAVGIATLTQTNWGMLVFAAGCAAYSRRWEGAAFLAGVLVVLLALAAAGRLSLANLFFALLTCLVVFLTNLFTARFMVVQRRLEAANAQIAQLAAAEERERIAMDLHDVLGHSLSVIVMKAELARRLADRDPIRSAAEIGEVEQLSRRALSDIRLAIAGYRAGSIRDEVALAAAVLRDAGLQVREVGDPPQPEPEVENALCLALREASTNVLRHARATMCEIRWEHGAHAMTLVVDDDGIGPGAAGAGLAGMAARMRAVGGAAQVSARPGGGTRVTIQAPAA